MPARLDFKAIAERVDIYAVAKHLGLTVVKDRAACPVCATERAIQFFPETNSFQCHASGNTRNSDCIALYSHIKGYDGMYRAAKELDELFGTADAAPDSSSTAPQKSEGRSQPAPASRPASKTEHAFDPEAYAAKLVYNDDVAALGITEDDAERLCIGHASTGLLRGRVAFPIRNADGSIAGFIGWNGEDLKLPSKWLLGNVVPFQKKTA